MSTPSEVSEFPTAWRTIDSIEAIDSRQLSVDTFELRSPTHTVTVNKEGFDIFRSGDTDKWNRWLGENHAKILLRVDSNGRTES